MVDKMSTDTDMDRDMDVNADTGSVHQLNIRGFII
jgi:hypothetical protein